MPGGWRRDYLRYRAIFMNILAVYRQRQDVRMFLEIILSLITVSFFSFFALRPTLLTIAQLVREISAKEETVAKMDQKIQDLASAQSIFLAQESKIALISAALPSSPSPELLISQIESLSVKHSLQLLGLNINDLVLVGEEKEERDKEFEALPQGAGKLGFSISVTGPFSNLSNFLTDLENLRRPVKIDSLTIQSTETEVGRSLVEFVAGRVPYVKAAN